MQEWSESPALGRSWSCEVDGRWRDRKFRETLLRRIQAELPFLQRKLSQGVESLRLISAHVLRKPGCLAKPATHADEMLKYLRALWPRQQPLRPAPQPEPEASEPEPEAPEELSSDLSPQTQAADLAAATTEEAAFGVGGEGACLLFGDDANRAAAIAEFGGDAGAVRATLSLDARDIIGLCTKMDPTDASVAVIARSIAAVFRDGPSPPPSGTGATASTYVPRRPVGRAYHRRLGAWFVERCLLKIDREHERETDVRYGHSLSCAHPL
eukprot:SAG11_NODE_3623_length_2329_cov_13.325561_2_plen_269_part_00